MKFNGKYFSLLIGLALAFVGTLQTAFAADPTNQPPATSANTNEVAAITTTEGTMVIEFWTDAAPKTIANFKKLAKSGFYDGTSFHRVIPGFMIQGGDPKTKESDESVWGTGDPGYKLDAEFNYHSHVRGVISMARSNDPNSAGCQFFICHGSPTGLDRLGYTTFGKLIKGFDVLDKIATTPTHTTAPNENIPNKRMGIISIKIVPAGAAQ